MRLDCTRLAPEALHQKFKIGQSGGLEALRMPIKRGPETGLLIDPAAESIIAIRAWKMTHSL